MGEFNDNGGADGDEDQLFQGISSMEGLVPSGQGKAETGLRKCNVKVCVTWRA